MACLEIFKFSFKIYLLKKTKTISEHLLNRYYWHNNRKKLHGKHQITQFVKAPNLTLKYTSNERNRLLQ